MIKTPLRYIICLAIIGMALMPTALQAQALVWPGDVNNDGIVNNLDLLFLGRAYGYQGPMRSDSSIVFIQLQANNWNDVFPDSLHTNMAHADANGSGTVDAMDTLAIVQNYGRQHGAFIPGRNTAPTPESPSLYFATDYAEINAGQPIELHASLGTPSFPVDSFFGIAFSWYYDTMLVKKNTVHAELDTRWIANATGLSMDQMLFLQRNMPDSGRIDIAISQRYFTNNIPARNISGYGNITRISAVIEDNLIGKTNLIYKLGITPVAISMVGVDLKTYGINAESDSLTIRTYTGVDEIASQDIKVYPNPAVNEITVEMGNRQAKDITLFDLTGRNVWAQSPQKSGYLQLNISTVPSGFYLMKIITTDGAITKKICIK